MAKNIKDTILIVDDEPGNLNMLDIYLRQAGFETFTATDGESALRAAARVEPDLILLDVIMPGLDGFEVCRRLKADAAVSDIPIIFLTFAVSSSDKIKGLELGAVDYITKPFEPAEVLARVNTHLTIRNLQKQLETQNIQLQRKIAARAQESLRASEAKNRALLQAIPDLLFVLDSDGVFLDYKTGKEQLFASPETILGKNIAEVMPPEIAQLYHGHLQRALQSKNTQTYEYQLQFPGQESPRNFEARMSVSDDDHVLVVVRNVTERVQAEQELYQAQKTAEKALRAAEAANIAKSAFLANMSHELRTPLSSILGYTQLLKRDPTLSEKQRNGVEAIHRSGEHLLMMINDLLDLSKIEAGKMEIEPSSFNLQDLLKTIVETVQIRAEEKGITLNYEATAALPVAVHADEFRLHQILLNLLSNAIKFTAEGSVTLRVHRGQVGKEARRQGDATLSPCLHFEVSDTGIGIEPEEMADIFAPFQQAGSRYRTIEGTGLGLAISKRLVEMMGGTLGVESTPGKGSTFWIELELPVVEEGAEADAERETHRLEAGRLIAAGTFKDLPPDRIAALLDMAEKGDIKGIRKQISDLERLGDPYKPLAGQLRQLAGRYQLREIRKLLKSLT